MKKLIPLNQLVVLVQPTTSIHDTILRLAEKRAPGQLDGIAVVLNDNQQVCGVLTDGDIRRAYARGVQFSLPVSEVMVKKPISLNSSTPSQDVLPQLMSRVASSGRLKSVVRHVLMVDEQNRLVDVLDVTELLLKMSYRSQRIAIYGLGHVGVTLAATLANAGHFVMGVETNPKLCSMLAEGLAPILEPGLADLLSLVVRNKKFSVTSKLDTKDFSVHIVAVGSPVDSGGKADETALVAVGHSMSEVLKSGDLVLLRSTVPVGFTRQRFIPFLEEKTSMIAGKDFHVAFTPERTVEGRALIELRTLPQIVGGLTESCTDRAASFWSTLTQTVVRVDSLEAAELVKVANNTYRDLCFAFSNELALLCDTFNLNSFRVIEGANEGYPRNPIPLPSPGVGGYCLTKDPLLYGQPFLISQNKLNIDFKPELGLFGRRINERAKNYPIELLKRWLKRNGFEIQKQKALVLGLAFKGYPETADLRGSTSVEIAQVLQKEKLSLKVWDAVVPKALIESAGFLYASDLLSAIREADIILLLNNHPSHPVLSIPNALAKESKLRFVFDGWHQLDVRELEQIPGVTYSTMGYMTSLEKGALGI